MNIKPCSHYKGQCNGWASCFNSWQLHGLWRKCFVYKTITRFTTFIVSHLNPLHILIKLDPLMQTKHDLVT